MFLKRHFSNLEFPILSKIGVSSDQSTSLTKLSMMPEFGLNLKMTNKEDNRMFYRHKRIRMV